MLIKKVNRYTFDVFTDTGWSNWSRFQVQNSQLKKTKGKPLTPQEYGSLKSLLKIK